MRKKSFYVGLLVVGAILVASSLLLLKADAVKTWSGACLGVGIASIAIGIAKLFMISWYKKHPEELTRAKIEEKDERNEFIRNKAKAQCSDIIQWLIMGVAWVTIFAGFPIWITLLLIGVFVLKGILDLYFMGKYNKEM